MATLLTLPVVALLMDRVGRRRFLLLGTFGMALASLGYLRVDAVDARPGGAWKGG